MITNHNLIELNKTFRVLLATGESVNGDPRADVVKANDLRRRLLALGELLAGRRLNRKQRALFLDSLYCGNQPIQ